MSQLSEYELVSDVEGSGDEDFTGVSKNIFQVLFVMICRFFFCVSFLRNTLAKDLRKENMTAKENVFYKTVISMTAITATDSEMDADAIIISRVALVMMVNGK